MSSGPGYSHVVNSKKKKAVEIQDSIRRVLFREWDPIGVNEISNSADEYDAYIAPVYRILAGSRSEQELVDFLHRTECDTIGVLCASREQLRPVARRLLILDVRL